MPDKDHYCIPQGEGYFLDWTKNFVQVVAANALSWGLAQRDIDVLKAKSEDFAQKLAKAFRDDATKADIRRKNTVHREIQTAFQDYVNEQIRFNKNIDRNGQTALRIYIPDETRTVLPRC